MNVLFKTFEISISGDHIVGFFIGCAIAFLFCLLLAVMAQ
jgi:hypothetical protein